MHRVDLPVLHGNAAVARLVCHGRRPAPGCADPRLIQGVAHLRADRESNEAPWSLYPLLVSQPLDQAVIPPGMKYSDVAIFRSSVMDLVCQDRAVLISHLLLSF